MKLTLFAACRRPLLPLALAVVGVCSCRSPQGAAPAVRPGNAENRINPGHYGWLGDFHDSPGSYPVYYDLDYFRQHHINWFWLGNQWVVPYLLSDSNQVREAICEFKHSSRIWYEAFWWGDHTRWGEPGDTQAFGLGSIARPVLDKLTAKGIRPGGDNLAGKTWLDLAADPALLASAKKTIAWQLDTIFEHCGTDALYGVVLSEEEPEVCLGFAGKGAEAYERFRADKDEVRRKMTAALNQLYDFVKERYPWLKVAPGVYPQWVQPDLKRDAVVMDFYPNYGQEEGAIEDWVRAWGTTTEQYILLWGYGNLDRRLECERFDRVSRGLLARGFRNLGTFHPKLALEDRIYRLYDVDGTGTYAPYELAPHADAVRHLVADTEEVAARIEAQRGAALPGRPAPGAGHDAYASRQGLSSLTDAWYAFRERALDEAYASTQRLKAYLGLATMVGILQAEGFLAATYSPATVLTPAALIELEKLSKEFRTLPEFYAGLVPLENGLRVQAADVAAGLGVGEGAAYAPALRSAVEGYLGTIAASLRNAECGAAFDATQALYRELRAAGADRSWRLRVLFGNRYGYPLNLRVDIAVDYGDGKLLTVRSDTPFEASSGASEEWVMYLPKRPVAVRFDTIPWSGTLQVDALEISQSRQTLRPTATADADHVTELSEWLAGKSPSFALSPWASRAGVKIVY